MQVVVVLVGELTLAQHTSLPGRDLRDDIRKNTQMVVGWKDRHANHIPEGYQDEKALQTSSHLERVLAELVAEHAVQEIPQTLEESRPPFAGLAILAHRFPETIIHTVSCRLLAPRGRLSHRMERLAGQGHA